MLDIKFDEKGLVPAVIQEAVTGEVLMTAYMNSTSLKETDVYKRQLLSRRRTI